MKRVFLGFLILQSFTNLKAGIKVILNTTPYKIDYTLEANDGTKIQDIALPGCPSVIEYPTYAASYIQADYSGKKDLPTIIYKDPALNGNFMFTFFEDNKGKLSIKESNPEMAHMSQRELALEYLKLENTIRKTQNLPAKSTEGIEGTRTLKQEKKGWFSRATPDSKREPEVIKFTIKEPTPSKKETHDKNKDTKKAPPKNIREPMTPAEKIKSIDIEMEKKAQPSKETVEKKIPIKKSKSSAKKKRRSG